MSELLVDFVTTLDGYASGDGWPGWWGLQGPEYLAWLDEQPEVTYLMGANTNRLMSGFAAGEVPAGQSELSDDEADSSDHLTNAAKVVFSSSLTSTPRRHAWADRACAGTPSRTCGVGSRRRRDLPPDVN